VRVHGASHLQCVARAQVSSEAVGRRASPLQLVRAGAE
jgi:hypothetical protein